MARPYSLDLRERVVGAIEGGLSRREAAEVFFQATGKHARLGRIPHAVIAGMGLFSPLLREVTEMLYQKEEPYIVDGSRFAAQFRDQAVAGESPSEAAVGACHRVVSAQFLDDQLAVFRAEGEHRPCVNAEFVTQFLGYRHLSAFRNPRFHRSPRKP